MTTEMIIFGVISIALGGGLLYAGRNLYPRLDLDRDDLSTVRLLTAVIAGVLLVTGLGLVAVGLAT